MRIQTILNQVEKFGSSAESVGAWTENKSALRGRIASWDTLRPRWSYHASSKPGAPQDAYPDDPQSGREVRLFRRIRGCVDRKQIRLERKNRILGHPPAKMELPRFIKTGSAPGCVSRRSSIRSRSSALPQNPWVRGPKTNPP